MSSGKIEGINNKIKTLRRQGYGYPDDDYFFLKLFDLSRAEMVRNPKPIEKVIEAYKQGLSHSQIFLQTDSPVLLIFYYSYFYASFSSTFSCFLLFLFFQFLLFFF